MMFLLSEDRLLKRQYVFEGDKARDLYEKIKLVGCKICDEDLKRIEIISINEKIKDGLIVIYLFENLEPNIQYYEAKFGTKGLDQITLIVNWFLKQKDKKNKYLRTYYEIDIDNFINIDQNINLAFNNDRNQLHYDLNDIEGEKLFNFRNLANETKFMKG